MRKSAFFGRKSGWNGIGVSPTIFDFLAGLDRPWNAAAAANSTIGSEPRFTVSLCSVMLLMPGSSSSEEPESLPELELEDELDNELEDETYSKYKI